MKRWASLMSMALLTPILCAVLAGCGGAGGQISVTISDTTDKGPYRAGNTPQFALAVKNLGPGDAPGVLARADMPANFRYKSTDSITGINQARTQPLDAHVGSPNPGWGLWNLPPPTVQNGTKTFASLEIVFTVDIEAAPAKYNVSARASDDNTSSDVISPPILVEIQAAPRLGVTARVAPASLKPNDMARYSVTVTNTGTAIAGNVDILITLPPVVTFLNSVTPFEGNASRSNPVDPVKGSVEVFYGGFNIPPASSAGPGIITVAFMVQVVARPPAGAYPLSVQVSDILSDVVTLNKVVSITVQAATPSPLPGVRATSSASPTH